MPRPEPSAAFFEALRACIGTRGRFDGREIELIEVIEHDPAVVFADGSGAQTIQDDQHGEAHRIVPRTYTVPLFSELGGLHPALEACLDETQRKRLAALLQPASD
ncbi:MAG: hypothetical protein KatS3mg121_1542 [Gammaproteobacteria bacterium]|nr:MAG: hypothetical protein KatS3mg121_1542 [Gammaproteobacteria bacterium]